ncbi:AfsR/SARP family transcriptional regulator [Butyrivibrio sp. XPD2006]|uniref:AfsR/SARP family transcriptional regulator n=1 Tax=Butyrivibrio sp. XPD2006 TaxID=1280668 RepID=UPI0003B73D56|nr:bacterial transcriptional activator domain-containing protein [Butyrivibrio sp. XPD2006]
MEHGDKSILQVNMFGGLAITYEGKNISIGKNKTAKYVQLLEIVWLSGEAGIQKEQLTSILYDREEQSNLSNSFNNLIYQLHKQIKKSGLPDHDYVVNRDGIFFTDDAIELDSDVLRFVHNIEQARAAEDEADVISFYKAAFDEYKSEVLPELATQEWLIIKSVQYQKMYAEAVVALGAYYEKKKDYETMHRIYKKAAELYPDDEWQIGEINALIGMEAFKEAYAVYDETVRYYTDELGVTPSNDLLDCYDKMSRQITNIPGKILQIRDGILEHRGAVAGEDDGAYDCSFPSFIDAYHILSRNMERSGQSVYMMLLNIVDYEGKRITNAAKLETRAKLLQEAITLTLRQGDTFCKYSASQFLLLLVGTNKESCKTVYRRLLNKFKLLAGPRTELEYSVVSLADLPDRLAEAK